jgi:hypothetical protein
VARFNSQIKSIQWDKVVFWNEGTRQSVALPQPASDVRLERLNAAIRDAASYPEFLRTVAAL